MHRKELNKMKFRYFLINENGETRTIYGFAPIPEGTLIQHGTGADLKGETWKVLTCSEVPEWF